MLTLPTEPLQGLASKLPTQIQNVLRSALSAQDNINRKIASTFSSITVWNWTTPQFSNGWKNFSTSLVGRFTVTPSGLVVLSGAISSGTIGSKAFTLPAKLAPKQDCNFAVDSNDAFGKLVVHSNGDVVPAVGSNLFFALDGVSFLPG